MDDTFRALFTAVLVVFAASAAGAEVTFIDAGETARLERDFGAARPAEATAVLAKSKWICDMYGMRSKLFVERAVDLYAFRRAADRTSKLANAGDQPIETYEIRDGGLTGENSQKGLRDELRLTKDGRLVGKLSLPAQKLTVAYSVCRGS